MPGLEFTHGFTLNRIVDQVFSITKTTINPKAPLNHQLASMFDRLLTTICFKMRRHRPCFIANLRWSVTLPEGFDVQVLVTASIIKLQSVRERQLSQTSAGAPVGFGRGWRRKRAREEGKGSREKREEKTKRGRERGRDEERVCVVVCSALEFPERHRSVSLLAGFDSHVLACTPLHTSRGTEFCMSLDGALLADPTSQKGWWG